MPVVTTPDAKGCFPMDHPLHMGIHMGPFSPPAIEKRVRDADLVLALGTVLTDMNLGASKPQVSAGALGLGARGRVNVSFHTYTEVALRDFVAALGREQLPRFRERVVYRDNLKRAKRTAPARRARINDLLLEMNHFLDHHPGYDVFAESGDALFGGLELRLRARRASTSRRATTRRWASACPPRSAPDRPRRGRSCCAATAPSR